MRTCGRCDEANSEHARFCQACGHRLPDGETPKETRRLVTVLFCDVIGSTAFARGLDAESVHGIFARYFEAMRSTVERHGGIVEKFIGDAVMAVFGIPKAHEDDAWRATKAAFEMRAALTPLNQDLERRWGVAIATRIGVNTGVVVAGGGGEALVTGEPVIVAARLEQAASPGDILLGPETHRLVRDAVETEPVPPLHLKGLDPSITAHRLLSVTTAVPGRHLDSPLVGRKTELTALSTLFDRTREQRRCELAIVLGQAGVGKTRVIEEFLDASADEAAMFTGQCLAYGEGITFWPLTEVLTEAAGLADADPPEIVRQKIGLLLAGDEQGPRIAERVAQAIGVAGGSAAPDETLWAIRSLFEHLARSRPLILVFRGFQYAEATFLGLIEHITERSRDAPILLICEGRDETESLRDLVRGRPNAAILRLQPLGAPESERLVINLLGAADLAENARRRIVEIAGGLPLYAEEIISMLIDEGHLRREDDRWVAVRDLSQVPIPSTVRALLAARLDGLTADERAVLDRASIVGMRFDVEEVEELSTPATRSRLPSHLRTLTTRGFIRRARTTTLGELTYEFRHILFREVTYASLPKHERAELHERYAEWLEGWSGERIEEFEEIVAYHFDQAVQLRHELGRPDDRTSSLSDRAGTHYSSAGRRASARGDIPATVALLSRSIALFPNHDRRRAELMPDVVGALLQSGDLRTASSTAGEMAIMAAESGDPSLEARAALTSSLVRSINEPGAASVEGFRHVATSAAEVFEARGEKGNLASAQAELAWSHWLTGDAGRMLELSGRALTLAREAEDALALLDAADSFGRALVLGPTPCGEAVQKIEMVRAELASYRMVDASIRLYLAELLGMMQRSEAASHHVREARDVFEDLGQRRWLAASEGTAGLLGWWNGSLEAAERVLSSCYRFSREHGGEIWGREAATYARVLLQLGRLDEADEVAATIAEGTPPHEVESQIVWRSVRGRIAAARGDPGAGMGLAREAVRLAEGTDFVSLLAPALIDLAECLRIVGEAGGDELVERASTLFERKGDEVGSSDARALLAGPPGAPRR
jgi:class 3 adenylate cyclase/tetratricopeptide (TPR) repeat protein